MKYVKVVKRHQLRYKRSQSWGCNVRQSDVQYCIAYLKVAKISKALITRKKLHNSYGDDVNQTYCHDNFAVYINIESLFYTPETCYMSIISQYTYIYIKIKLMRHSNLNSKQLFQWIINLTFLITSRVKETVVLTVRELGRMINFYTWRTWFERE